MREKLATLPLTQLKAVSYTHLDVYKRQGGWFSLWGMIFGVHRHRTPAILRVHINGRSVG